MPGPDITGTGAPTNTPANNGTNEAPKKNAPSQLAQGFKNAKVVQAQARPRADTTEVRNTILADNLGQIVGHKTITTSREKARDLLKDIGAIRVGRDAEYPGLTNEERSNLDNAFASHSQEVTDLLSSAHKIYPKRWLAEKRRLVRGELLGVLAQTGDFNEAAKERDHLVAKAKIASAIAKHNVLGQWRNKDAQAEAIVQRLGTTRNDFEVLNKILEKLEQNPNALKGKLDVDRPFHFLPAMNDDEEANRSEAETKTVKAQAEKLEEFANSSKGRFGNLGGADRLIRDPMRGPGPTEIRLLQPGALNEPGQVQSPTQIVSSGSMAGANRGQINQGVPPGGPGVANDLPNVANPKVTPGFDLNQFEDDDEQMHQDEGLGVEAAETTRGDRRVRTRGKTRDFVPRQYDPNEESLSDNEKLSLRHGQTSPGVNFSNDDASSIAAEGGASGQQKPDRMDYVLHNSGTTTRTSRGKRTSDTGTDGEPSLSKAAESQVSQDTHAVNNPYQDDGQREPSATIVEDSAYYDRNNKVSDNENFPPDLNDSKSADDDQYEHSVLRPESQDDDISVVNRPRQSDSQIEARDDASSQRNDSISDEESVSFSDDMYRPADTPDDSQDVNVVNRPNQDDVQDDLTVQQNDPNAEDAWNADLDNMNWDDILNSVDEEFERKDSVKKRDGRFQSDHNIILPDDEEEDLNTANNGNIDPNDILEYEPESVDIDNIGSRSEDLVLQEPDSINVDDLGSKSKRLNDDDSKSIPIFGLESELDANDKNDIRDDTIVIDESEPKSRSQRNGDPGSIEISGMEPEQNSSDGNTEPSVKL